MNNFRFDLNYKKSNSLVLIHNLQAKDYYYEDQFWIKRATRKTKKISNDWTKQISESENLSNPKNCWSKKLFQFDCKLLMFLKILGKY